MNDLYHVKVGDVIRVLRKLGYRRGSRIRGTIALTDPVSGRRTCLPSNTREDVPGIWFTLLLHDIGLSVEEFHRLRKAA